MDRNTAGEELAALIGSMDRTERRYFRLHAQGRQQREQKVYLQLYDHIVSQGEWSEEQIAAVFSGQRFLKQLNVLRSQLHRLLMDALRSYHADKTIQSEFSRRLDEIEILFQRKLYASCKRAIQAASKRAEQLQLPHHTLEVLKWEMRLERQQASPHQRTRIIALHQRMAVLLEQMQVESKLLARLDTLLWQVKSKPGVSPEPESDPALDSGTIDELAEPEKLPFDARILYHYILAYTGFLQSNTEEFFTQHQAIIRIWEAHPDRIRLEEGRYLKVLGNHAESCAQADRMEEALKMTSKMQRVLDRSTAIEPSERLRILHVRLRILMVSQSWKDAYHLLPTIIHALSQYGHTIAASVRLVQMANVLITCFMNQRWSEVLDWAITLDRELRNSHSWTWENLIRTATWVAYYELGDLDRLESMTRKAQMGWAEHFPHQVLAQLAILAMPQSLQEKSQAFELLRRYFAEDKGVLGPHLELLRSWVTV
ncbi:MAG: hypothetical protein U0176_13125 [Bacteroidia bacterium]